MEAKSLVMTSCAGMPDASADVLDEKRCRAQARLLSLRKKRQQYIRSRPEPVVEVSKEKEPPPTVSASSSRSPWSRKRRHAHPHRCVRAAIRASLSGGTVQLRGDAHPVVSGPANMQSRWSQNCDTVAAWEQLLTADVEEIGVMEQGEEHPSNSMGTPSADVEDIEPQCVGSDDALGFAAFLRAATSTLGDSADTLATSSRKVLEELQEAARVAQLEGREMNDLVERGYAAVLATMAAAPAVEEVQEAGCFVIAAVMADKGGKVSVNVSDMALQTVHTVLRAMACRVAARGMQEAGCRALKEIAANACVCIPDDLLGAAVRLVIHVMNEHATSSELQVVACGVIRNITALKREWQDQVLELGGGYLIVRAMRQFPEDPHVQWAGCWALFCLAIGNLRTADIISKGGGTDAVAQAMTLHKMEAKVQEAGCWALCELARHETRGEIATWTEHVRLVSRAMRTHTTKDVRDAGSAALRKLCTRACKEPARSPQPKRCRITVRISLPTIQEREAQDDGTVVPSPQ